MPVLYLNHNSKGGYTMETNEIIMLVVFFAVYFLFLSVMLAYAVVSYVLGSKGLYAIAARRGISNPWMAWIPVAGNWILGSVSDQYQLRKYGQDPNLRKKLLIFSIITGGSLTGTSFGSFSVNFNMVGIQFWSVVKGPTECLIRKAGKRQEDSSSQRSCNNVPAGLNEPGLINVHCFSSSYYQSCCED